MQEKVEPIRNRRLPALLGGIWQHMSKQRKIQALLLLCVMLLSGLAELLSLGSVFPFLAILSDPTAAWTNPLINNLATRLGISEARQLIIPVTALFLAATLIAAAVRVINLWLNGRLAAGVGSDLSCDAYRCSIYQPYEIHVQKNSSQVITAATTQVSAVLVALSSFLQLFNAIVVAAFLLVGLMIIDWSVAISAILLFGIAYRIVAVNSRRELRINGKKLISLSSQQLKALQEGLGAIREVLLAGTQETYINYYRNADLPQRRIEARNRFLVACPRYVLEALGMTSIAIVGLLLVRENGEGISVIPRLGALALGAQRILPALQQIYSGWAKLKTCQASIVEVLEVLNQPVPLKIGEPVALTLAKSIRLKDIYFRYPQSERMIIQGMNLDIKAGERIGIIGSTGSGKSTTIDILMGLLTPSSGMLEIDGINLYAGNFGKSIQAWRSSISHVPQSIYLADCSIAENVAFGIPPAEIDLQRVKYASKVAQIAGFIESLPEGYSTFVGERGVRLSGGQRQRIGIARALYRETPVLIFDEATSALDDETEGRLMQSIHTLSRKITLIMIAHRLTTLKRCDRIFKIENGSAEAASL